MLEGERVEMARRKSGRRASWTSVLSHKGDTPVKRTLTKREKYRRVMVKNCYEALPEEPEGDESNVPAGKPSILVRTNKIPIFYKSGTYHNSPAFTEHPRDKVISTATPTNQSAAYRGSPCNPASQMTPKNVKGVKEPFKGKEKKLSVSQESTITPSMEHDTSFSSDDEEVDCYCSTSATSSSLPSPEIFREDNYVASLRFPIEEELQGPHLFHIKNSTLLDVSYAENIHVHQPPNLSTIIDTSMSFAEKDEISHHSGPIADPEKGTDHFKPDIRRNTPPKLTSRRPIVCKKKVHFKSPVVTKSFGHNPSGPGQKSSPLKKLTLNEDTPRKRHGEHELNSTEDTLRLRVTLKRPTQVKLFDFADDSERDVFFQRFRERSERLRNAPLFPLTAASHTEPSATADTLKSTCCM